MKLLRRRIVFYSYVTLGVFLFEIIFPATASALTGGPSTPEVQSFEPIGTSDMVDIFSGDFKYNIPLMEVDGYPVNISYSGGVNMDQEASWVGLGWNLNPGVINRSMRGIPDDFQGDEVVKEIKLRNNVTFGGSFGKAWEIFGKDFTKITKNTEGTNDTTKVGALSVGFNFKLGFSYNNYDGTSIDVGTGINSSLLKVGGSALSSGLNFGYTGSSGATLSANTSFDFKRQNTEKKIEGGIGSDVSTSVNSRSGMKALTFGWNGTLTKNPNSKNKVSAQLLGGGSEILFGSQTFTPSISVPMNNFAISLTYNWGKELKGLTVNKKINGYVSIQKIRDPKIIKKAYGYMHLEDAGWEDMMDFNREKDGPFSENHTNLPIPVPTYDIFSVSGHGIGGTFRMYRNDNIYSREETNENYNSNTSAGVDIGFPDKIKFGINLSFVQNKTMTSNFHEGNQLQELAKYVKKSDLPNSPLYEPVFFKQMGEMTRSNAHTHPGVFGYALLAPQTGLDFVGPRYDAQVGRFEPTGLKELSNLYFNPTWNVQTARQPRNMVMQALTAFQAERFGLTQSIQYYNVGEYTPISGVLAPTQEIERISDFRKEHHISEIRVHSTDGSRYIYGLPAYNKVQEEISFSIGISSAPAGNCNTGLVSYNSTNVSVSKQSGNQNGKDHFVQRIKTPAYAYAYHLTGIVSPDYVDLTGDGISDDDMGTAVRFDYQMGNDNYKWRTPYQEDKAIYNEGRKTDYSDDKGSIIYGEKEIYYLHSIVGKNHIAIFYLGVRADGFGVEDINGGIAGAQYALDSIVLYNKQDFYKNGSDAYKIKGVHFQYDYTLCGSVENFLSEVYSENFPYEGKLTLKKVFFTYGNSFKGKLSPYVFNYNKEEASDYKYHIKGHDRWGTFLRAGAYDCSELNGLSTAEFPYTPQNKDTADMYAGAWSLSEIILPSGGKISIEYEADDYGYVQDKKAMAMMQIEGFGKDTAYSDRSDLLFTKKGEDVINNYVFFDLGGLTNAQQLRRIVEGIKTVQFNVFVDINGSGKFEFVKGYADVDTDDPNYYGLTNDNYSGFLKLKLVHLKDKDKGGLANPISMNVWNWSRIYASDLVYNQKASDNVDEAKAFKGFYEMVGMFNEIANMTLGIYGNLKRRGFGQEVNTNRSFIRLQARDTKKIGGGHRVKSIKINDNWAIMGAANTTESDFEYGQEYEYTTKEKGADGVTYTISSGVAAYEPSVGSDENPLVMPRYVREELKLVPDLMYMDDSPLGESFMPPAQVGYSKVTVKSISHQGVSRTATGKQEHEFYTAKDFPVRFEETSIKVVPIRPNFFQKLFNVGFLEETSVTASQGYRVILNDMHGKPKAQYTYSESSEAPIGGVKYEYLTHPDDPSQLSNTVKVVSPNGAIQEKDLATEVEVQSDYRQSYNEVQSASINVNTDFFTVAAFPLLIPSLYNAYKKSTQKIQTAVTCKVVNRYGILHKTTAIKEGSQIKTENLLYDEITGAVLVSSVQNEFDDNIYSVSTPAHWAYDQGMGPAYKNTGVILNLATLSSDSIMLPNGLNVRDYLVPGDEVLVTDLMNGNWYRCHVYEGANYKLNLIDEKGGLEFNNGTSFSIEVIRSGRRNLQSTPIQQMSMVSNPMAGGTLSIDSVISASAVEYSNYWPFYCDKAYSFTCDTSYLLPLPEIFSFLNDAFGQIQVSNAGSDIDRECMLERLGSYGYKSSSLDSLFTKAIVSGNEVYTLSGATTTCVKCFDSLFIKLAHNVYKGFSTNDLTKCQEEIQGNCKNTYTPVTSEVPYASIYESFRYILDSIQPTCISDSGLVVQLENGSTYQDDGDLVFSFTKCETTCKLRIHMPNRYCYTNIEEVLDIKYYSNSTFSISMITELNDGTTDTLVTTGSVDCVNLRKINCTSVCVTPDENTVLNPYQMGILGNWRIKRQYAFVENRRYASTPNPAKDGTYANYSSYWSYHAPTGKMIPTTSTKWIWANQVTKYTPHGNEIENQDALGRYSSALFGFNYTLPIAVAGNTKYEQLAYESFEENSEFWTMANCYQGHFGFEGYIPTEAIPTTQYAHSGKYSLNVKAAQSISSQNDRTFCTDASDPFESTEMVWRNCYCVGKFNPDTGRYILSAWVKEGVNLMDTSYLNAGVQVKLHKTGSVVETYTLKGQGQIIDGWQRIFGEFRISDSVEQVEIILLGATSVDSWFDDLRIHPFNSNMRTYAYDQITLRLMAELDENNFATFYEYDQEGALIRVKKETVRGVQTLKEVRKSIIKTTEP